MTFAFVGLCAAAMAGILAHAVVSASRRRRSERAEEAAARVVTVRFEASADGGRLADPYRFDLADRVDHALGAAGEVTDARVTPSPGAEGRGTVELVVRVFDGRTSMPALRRALLAARVPAGAMLSWPDRGVTARERLDRARA